jgi:hypothetical protein
VRSVLLHKRRMRPSEIGAVAITRFFTRFSLQSTAGMSENSGTDARFPYEHRQNVVVRLCMFLLFEHKGIRKGAYQAEREPHIGQVNCAIAHKFIANPKRLC